jgi:hypothetical protein
MSLVLHNANSHPGGGAWGPDDYDVYDDTRAVGRIYRVNIANELWWWGVSFQLTRRKSFGTAGTLDGAKAAFRAEYERWLKEAVLLLAQLY